MVGPAKAVVMASMGLLFFLAGWQWGQREAQRSPLTGDCYSKNSVGADATNGCPPVPLPSAAHLCPSSLHSWQRHHLQGLQTQLDSSKKKQKNEDGMGNEWGDGGALTVVFSTLHHPDTHPAELVWSAHKLSPENPFQDCQSVYLTRTGARANLANKCLAVVKLPPNQTSPYVHSYRVGTVAKLTNMYQQDFLDENSLKKEARFLPQFLQQLDKLVRDFIDTVGPPAIRNAEGVEERRTVIIIVANDGVMDLVLNFICSCRQAGIGLENLVVFLGQEEHVPLVRNMGAHPFYNEALGSIPKKAAAYYGDNTFGILMWLKTTSVYLASKAGFNVLFQDADLVWIRDPVPHLQSEVQDIAFMDDGARTPRFTPFFVNSGFYYQRYTPRTQYLMEKMVKAVIEIFTTNSHQATLTRQMTESQHLVGLQFSVLKKEDFPSGMVYHHQKKYIRDMKAYLLPTEPYVFHMCWTSSREDKVKYFKDLGLWFLPDNNYTATERQDNGSPEFSLQDVQQCSVGREMLQWSSEHSSDSIANHCCQPGVYWHKKPK